MRILARSLAGRHAGAVDAIREIKGTIQNLDDIAASIAAATQEQGGATQEVARNVQEVAKTQIVSSDAAAATGSADETSKQAGSWALPSRC